MKNEVIRLGLIGCGNMMEAHAQSINNCKANIEITAVCDIDVERAERVAQALNNNSFVTTDYHKMIEDFLNSIFQ